MQTYWLKGKAGFDLPLPVVDSQPSMEELEDK